MDILEKEMIIVVLILISVMLHALGNVEKLAFMQMIDLLFNVGVFVGLLLTETTLQQMLLYLSASVTGYFICFAIATKIKQVNADKQAKKTKKRKGGKKQA